MAELWRVHADLERTIRWRGTDAEVTADVIAETYVVVWRRLHDVPLDEGSARAWIFTTARNIQANMYRRSLHQAELERAVAAQPGLTAPPEPVSARLEAVEVFESLSRDDQRLLRLVVSEGPTVVALAAWLGCSEAAAATRLCRARARLDTAMQAEGGGGGGGGGRVAAARMGEGRNRALVPEISQMRREEGAGQDM